MIYFKNSSSNTMCMDNYIHPTEEMQRSHSSSRVPHRKMQDYHNLKIGITIIKEQISVKRKI